MKNHNPALAMANKNDRTATVSIQSLLSFTRPVLLLLTLAGLALLGYGPAARAHHPHDIIDALAVSPGYSSDKTVYIANSEHLHKSVNGGASWKELSNGLDHNQPISSIVIAPATQGAATILISTLGSGIYRSADAGASWEKASSGLQSMVIRQLTAITGNLLLATDDAGHLYRTKDTGSEWQAVSVPGADRISAISPPAQLASPRILAGDARGNIFLSIDYGASWEKISRLPTATEITVLAFDPADTSGNTFFTGTHDNGLLQTSNGGKSFRSPENSNLASDHIVALAFSPDTSRDNLMVATTWRRAAFLSTDGGTTWTQHGTGLTTDKQANSVKYRSAHFRQASITAGGKTLFLAGFDGLFKSDNGGHDWHELETLPVGLIKYVGISPAGADGYSIGLTTYGGGAYLSSDNGASWLIGNRGIKTARLMGINFSPAYSRDKTVFTGSVGYLLKSTDNGTTWNTIKLKYPKSLRKRIVQKLIKLGMPKSLRHDYLDIPDRHPVYPTVIRLSPDFENDKTMLFGTRWHGMYRSDNAGISAYNTFGYTGGQVTSLALSPDFPRDHTAFMYVRGDSIYKSSDSGASWHKLTSGPPFPATQKTNHRQPGANKHFVILFSPGYRKDKTLFIAGPTGLFKSVDQGKTWQEQAFEIPGAKPNILAIDISPDYTNDQTLLISLKGHGLYKSQDGGKNFVAAGRSLLKDNHSIETLVFSSNYPEDNTLYAASDEALLCSTDGGNLWDPIERPIRYEDRRGVMHYEGNWTRVDNPDFSASTTHRSETVGDKASLDFFGCKVRWLSTLSTDGGIANVYIDHSLAATIDLHSDQKAPMAIAFTSTNLPCAPHTITIEVGKRLEDNPTGNRVALDGFDVLPTGQGF